MNSPLLVSLVIFLHFVWLGDCELLGRTNSSKLCSRAPVQSCIHQLYQANDSNHVVLDESACKVQAANNTRQHLCSKQAWSRQEICNNIQECGLHLEVYRHATQPSLPLYRTAFNLTLSNPALDTKIRYSDALSSNFTFCVNFTLSKTLQISNPLWYDCVFHNRHLEGQSLRLEYLIDNKYGLLTFRVPQGNFQYIFMHEFNALIVF